MAALSPRASGLPFLRADERPAAPAWLPEEAELRFAPRGARGDAELYAGLCERLAGFSLLPGARRQGDGLSLPLKAGPFSFVLQGRVRAEFLSSELGEAQRHLHAVFELPGAWALHWRSFAGHGLIDGRVRLHSATWMQPGERRSFRHIVAARGLRRALARAFDDLKTGEQP